MNAELFIRRRLIQYLRSPDKRAAEAAKFAARVFDILYAWDSAGEQDMPRIVAGKSSVGEMEELSAQHKVNGDQLSRLMMGGAGEVLNARSLSKGGQPLSRSGV